MQFCDDGYIINMRKHGESSLILTVLTREHGKVIGYVKNCLHKRNLGIYQLGNRLQINAYSRVDENMLSIKAELLEPCAVNFISHAGKLAALSSLCELCNTAMPELSPLDRFFYYIESFFNLINEDNWIVHYCFFEFFLLDNLGIGLDLSECAATGTTENLAYVSPKSGRAVCEEAGCVYKEKLFSYPHFIVTGNYRPTSSEMADLLKMTEFFLTKNFFQTHGLKFPQNRARLLNQLEL
ncbi:MAG: DNA repair protein RecO [Alphaproteobacteria bacterium]|nr:DNA repair protein RecO [Alphaproteobacteria bacterium]